MSLHRHREPDPFEPQERFNGLSIADFNTLAQYNAEKARGLMHTPEWQAKMADLQSHFDAADQELARTYLLRAWDIQQMTRAEDA